MAAGMQPGRHNLITVTSVRNAGVRGPSGHGTQNGSDVEQRLAEVKLAWIPSSHAPAFPSSWV